MLPAWLFSGAERLEYAGLHGDKGLLGLEVGEVPENTPVGSAKAVFPWRVARKARVPLVVATVSGDQNRRGVEQVYTYLPLWSGSSMRPTFVGVLDEVGGRGKVVN